MILHDFKPRGKARPISSEEIEQMQSLRDQNVKLYQIAKKFNRHWTTVAKYTTSESRKAKKDVAGFEQNGTFQYESQNWINLFI
jgi:hypothetical protein